MTPRIVFRFFKLDEHRVPVACTYQELLAWLAEHDEDRVVGKWQCGDVEVSTVFIYLARGNFEPPLLFETMIFGGDRHGQVWFTSTWDDAEKKHCEVMKLVDANAFRQ